MVDVNAPSQAPLKAKISLGALQHFSASLVVRVLAIVSIAVLGRLLTPVDFGIFAYAVFVSTLIETCFYRHFQATLIRLQEATEAHLHTLFTLRLLTGLVLAALIAASAVPMAQWVGSQELKPVLYWMAFAQVIAAFVSPRFLLLEKEMRFGPAASQLVLVRVLTTCSAILLGFLIGNHWALVTGLILAPMITVAHAQWTAPYWPRLDLSKWRDFSYFGMWVTASTLLNFLALRIDRLILGPFLGVAAVGLYRMGVDLAELSAHQITAAIDRVIYPALASKRGNKSQLKDAYLSTQAVVLGTVLPVALSAAVSANEILRIIAGPQWLDAAPVIWALAPLIALNALEGGVRSLLYVHDAPQKLFFRNLLIFTITVPLITAGVLIGGFTGVILAAAVAKLFALVLTLRLADRETGERFTAPFLRAWRSLVAGVLMVLAVLVTGLWLPATVAETTIIAALLTLVIKCLVGFSTYLGLNWVLWRLAGQPEGVESFTISLLTRFVTRVRQRGSK